MIIKPDIGTFSNLRRRQAQLENEIWIFIRRGKRERVLKLPGINWDDFGLEKIKFPHKKSPLTLETSHFFKEALILIWNTDTHRLFVIQIESLEKHWTSASHIYPFLSLVLIDVSKFIYPHLSPHFFFFSLLLICPFEYHLIATSSSTECQRRCRICTFWCVWKQPCTPCLISASEYR